MEFLSKLKKFSNEREFRVALFCVLLALIIFAFFFYLFSAPADFPKGALFKVESGSTLRSISLEMKEDHLIRSRLAFEAFAIIYGGERHLRPGYYLFEGKEPVFEIGRRIALGDRHLAPIRVTFPEGTSSAQMAEILAAKLPDFDPQKFLADAAGQEGYLFPDTYFFYYGDAPEDVLGALEKNFDQRIAAVRPEISASGRTEREIITMASILEKEAEGKEDRGIIAGILWKRIALGMPLEADAAPETYRQKGLPAAPIGNPGLGAIEDAIHPVSSPYLFYLHDKDGNVHYAATFAEHENNIKKYLK